jgi:hypothetical protein
MIRKPESRYVGLVKAVLRIHHQLQYDAVTAAAKRQAVLLGWSYCV